MIIDGKPHDTETECFPGALKRKAGSDGLLTDEPAEPIAVDVRVHGKRRTLLKVVAGITGVEFDELERRDRRRRAMQVRAMAASALMALSVLLVAGAIVEQNKAQQAVIARAVEVLPARQPVLAAHLALAGLPKASDLWPVGDEAASTLKASGYAFATRVLDPQRKFNGAILTSDGTRLITQNSSNVVSIWEVHTATPVADLDFIHYGGPTTFAFLALSPDETRLLTWNTEGPPQLWDAQNGSWIATLGEDDTRITVKFSADSHWIAVPFDNASAALFEAETGCQVATFGRARAVEVSGDGSRVVTVTDTGTAVLWGGQTGRRVAELGTAMSNVSELRLSADGRRVVAYPRQGSSPILWDATQGKRIVELGKTQEAVYRFAMSKDGKRVATSNIYAEPVLWDSEDGHRIRTIGPAGPNSVTFSESGDFVVISSTGHAAFVSDARTGEPIGGIGTEEEGAGGLYFLPGYERVALLTSSIGLVLRDSRSGAFIARLANDNEAYGLTISQDGRIIQVKDANHWVRLWDGETGVLIGALAATREGHSWMIDRNNVHAVTRGIDGTVRLRRLDANLNALLPATLRNHVCRENREVIGAFPAEERNAATPVGLALRGHPWHACDWHGLKSREGWLQFLRYWGTRAGLPWEYEPWETSALDKWLKAKPLPAL